jgi:hypothetical protein
MADDGFGTPEHEAMLARVDAAVVLGLIDEGVAVKRAVETIVRQSLGFYRMGLCGRFRAGEPVNGEVIERRPPEGDAEWPHPIVQYLGPPLAWPDDEVPADVARAKAVPEDIA